MTRYTVVLRSISVDLQTSYSELYVDNCIEAPT